MIYDVNNVNSEEAFAALKANLKRSDSVTYTCKVECKLRISIPKENFANKDDDEIFNELSNIYSIITSTQIDYEDVGDEKVTDTSAEIVLSGSYAYYYENDRD